MGWRCLGGLSLGEVARRTWSRTTEEGLPTRAAAAAYYALTALVPFLGLVVTLAANLMPDPWGAPGAGGTGREAIDEAQRLMEQLLPDDAVPVVARELARLREAPPVRLLSFGLLLSVWFSSGVFGVLIDALNRIQRVPETRPTWKVYLTAAGLTFLEAVIMLGTLGMLVIWPQVRGVLGLGDAPGPIGSIWEWLPVALGAQLSFAVTARLGPARPPRWRWVTPGSVFGTAVFLLAALGLRLYVAHWGNYANTYGSLAGVMLLTTWFWIVAFVVLLAFQIDKVIDDVCAEES